MSVRSKKQARVRVGVVGMGNMGSYYAGMFQRGEIPCGELVAVCDSDPEKLAGFPGPCPSLGQLLQRVDAIVIATPHYSHPAIGIQALRAGLHVLVEKPLAATAEAAEKLLAAHTSRRQVFGEIFNQRTDPLFVKVRELVRSGELGEIHRVQWTITDWFRSQAYYDSGQWRATWAGEGGGVLLNQCVHNLDLLQWICGMPNRVRSLCCYGKHHEIGVEDDVSAILEFPNGATGVLVTSTGEAPGLNRLEVSGDRGRLTCESGRLVFLRNEVGVRHHIRASKEGYSAPGFWRIEIPVGERGINQHRKILENFIAAICDGEPLIAPAAEGLASMELVNGILLSSHEGQPVPLPVPRARYAAFLRGRVAAERRKKTTPYRGGRGNYLK